MNLEQILHILHKVKLSTEAIRAYNEEYASCH